MTTLDKGLHNIKAIFFGTPFFAKDILLFLLQQNIQIVLVVTQKPKPFGRKLVTRESDVEKVAKKMKLEILETDKILTDQANLIRILEPDIIITASYGSLLPKKVLNLPRFGSINVHPSLLPKYRGPSPIQSALLEGERETGTTIMLMNEKMDAGDVLNQKKIRISPRDNYPSLEKKLLAASKTLLASTLKSWINDSIDPIKQIEKNATFSKIIKRGDGLIDWNTSSSEIINKHRAYFQWPRIFSFFQDNNKRKKIIFHELHHVYSQTKGKILPGEVRSLGGKVLIGTKSGAILPKYVQLEGKSAMTIEDFVRGKKNFIGSILG